MSAVSGAPPDFTGEIPLLNLDIFSYFMLALSLKGQIAKRLLSNTRFTISRRSLLTDLPAGRLFPFSVCRDLPGIRCVFWQW